MSITDVTKMAYVNHFMDMLHKEEYIIDSKAKEIPYDDKSTLADY
jgi:hypothetical protein